MRSTILYLFVACQIHCLAQSDIPQQLDVVTESILQDPGNASLFVQRATLHLEVMDLESALSDLGKSTELAGENFPPALITLATLYLQQDDYSTALQYVDHFLNIKRINIRGFQLKAEILEAQGEFEEAIDYRKKVLIHSDKDHLAYYLSVIELLRKQERYPEAIFYCQTAKRVMGRLPEIDGQLAELIQLRGEL